MKSFIHLLFALLFFISHSSTAQSLTELEKKRIGLPNGWSLTPVGRILPLAIFP
jgi:hypothetical protein